MNRWIEFYELMKKYIFKILSENTEKCVEKNEMIIKTPCWKGRELKIIR